MKLSSLRELSTYGGLPFEFVHGDETFTCIAIFLDDAAIIVDDGIEVYDAIDELYHLPSEDLK